MSASIWPVLIHQILAYAASQDVLEMMSVTKRGDFPGHPNLWLSSLLLPLTDEMFNGDSAGSHLLHYSRWKRPVRI